MLLICVFRNNILAIQFDKMYSKTKSLSLLLCLVLLSVSCQNEQEIKPELKGQISFSFNGLDNARIAEFNPKALLATVKNSNDEEVLHLEMFELFQLGDAYITNKQVLLPEGDYVLTDLLVTNASGQVTHLVPKIGFEDAELVQHPLPFSFSILGESETSIKLEVVEVRLPGSEYGYPTFEITPVSDKLDIEIEFDLSLPEYFENDGYDSAIIQIQKGDKLYETKLTITGEKTGQGILKVNRQDLIGDVPMPELTPWLVTLKTYFEVIDAVETITHTNESILTKEIPIGPVTNKIIINDSFISENGFGSIKEINENDWDLISHFEDDQNYFKATIDNDICTPSFILTAKRSEPFTYYLYKDLYIFNSQKNDYDYNSEDKWIENLGIAGMSYNVSILGCNPNTPYNSLTDYGGLFLDVYKLDGTYTSGLAVVWESQIDPHDPIRYQRTTQSKKGYFKVVESNQSNRVRMK